MSLYENFDIFHWLILGTLLAVILMISSVCVPYYTDNAGIKSGVFVDVENLGLISENDRNTCKALPIITILFGILTFMLLVVKVMYDGGNNLLIATFVATCFTALFSVVTLSFQMNTSPIAGGDTLADRSKMDKGSVRHIEFNEGMYLTAVSMALYLCLALFLCRWVMNN